MFEVLASGGAVDTSILVTAGALVTASLLMATLYRRKERRSDATVDLLRQAVVANIEAVDEIRESDKRLEMMLECVQRNSEAMTGVKMAVEQNSHLLQRLNIDYNAHSEALAEAVKAIKRSNGNGGGQ